MIHQHILWAWASKNSVWPPEKWMVSQTTSPAGAFASGAFASHHLLRIKTGGLDDLLLNRSWELCCTSETEEINKNPHSGNKKRKGKNINARVEKVMHCEMKRICWLKGRDWTTNHVCFHFAWAIPVQFQFFLSRRIAAVVGVPTLTFWKMQQLIGTLPEMRPSLFMFDSDIVWLYLIGHVCWNTFPPKKQSYRHINPPQHFGTFWVDDVFQTTNIFSPEIWWLAWWDFLLGKRMVKRPLFLGAKW